MMICVLTRALYIHPHTLHYIFATNMSILKSKEFTVVCGVQVPICTIVQVYVFSHTTHTGK